MILNDRQIRARIMQDEMISPYDDDQKRDVRRISHGLSSYGYDVRLSNEFKVATDVWSAVIDPKSVGQSFVDVMVPDGEPLIIPPNSFVLGTTVEYMKIPENVMVLCLGKSTYARCGLIVNVTPLEPGWEGEITIEISNTTRSPAKVYPFEGIAQLVFFTGERPGQTYPERSGRYQGQRGVTTAKAG